MAGWDRDLGRLWRAAIVVAAGSCGVASAGCPAEDPDTGAADEDDDGAKDKKKKKKSKDDDGGVAPASSTAAPSAPEGANQPANTAAGTSISIPAGTLRAGSRCYDVPRIRPDELEHDEIALGAFEIDAYPYPNEPGQPAKLDVTWQEAKSLCEARGKRLCTELEWERACKGNKSSTYLWGDAFKKGSCDGRKDHLTDQRPSCKSELGVMDMMGLALEWTASDWERGTPNGQKVVRGARPEAVSWLSARCAHSRDRDPNKKHDNVGFRCCKGEESSARVALRQRQRTTIEAESGIDTPFEMTLMRAMPKDHRGTTGIELSFDQVWRWHPVANEELIVARWKGKPDAAGAFYEIAVFKLCGNTAYRAASMRGPVEKIDKPKVGVSAKKLSFGLTTGSHRGELGISYWHGSVKFTEPSFVKKGNQLQVRAGRNVKKRRRTVKARPR